MSHSPNSDRPTDSEYSDQLTDYLSYRITVDHIDVDKVKSIVTKYASEYIIWPHRGDSDIPKEHFHIIIPTQDKKLSDRLSKCFRTSYQRTGNGFHASKYFSNGVADAIAYLKHDASGDPVYEGSYWAKLISDTEVKSFKRDTSRGTKPVREKLGDPMLTLSNLLKQCMKHRDKETNLQLVIARMQRDGWIPSRDLIVNGVPEEYYEIWDQRINKKDAYVATWMQPHQRSEKRKEYADVPCYSRYNN